MYPLDEHAAWFNEYFQSNVVDRGFFGYVLDGGDFVKLTLDRCREKGIAAFISYRLNDAHHVGVARNPKAAKIGTVSRFYMEHPEYRIGPEPHHTFSWYGLVQNWAIPEVREHKYRLIEELCQNYDLDGLELDFMRHPAYFNLGSSTSEQRGQVMVEFVGRVRDMLDRTARNGRRRWLAVRIPAHLPTHDGMGIDVQAFADAGVDMFNLSTYSQTEQQTSLAQIRELAPRTPIYHELTFISAVKSAEEGWTTRRTTPEQFHTAGHLAYSRGADGISLFNFQYYRGLGRGTELPIGEPPFQLVADLRDANYLAQQPQHYYLSTVWNDPPMPGRPLPRTVEEGQTALFTLDMVPPTGGWHATGKHEYIDVATPRRSGKPQLAIHRATHSRTITR